MLVMLRLDWFGPKGVMYQKNPKGTEIPDEFCKRDDKGKWLMLPSTTKLLAEAPPTAAEKAQSLRDADPERAAAEAEGHVRRLAELEDAILKAPDPAAKKAANQALKRYQLQRELEANQ